MSEPNGSEPADNLTRFEKFERLAKQIVQVPKSEVDARRKTERAARRRVRSRRDS